jgi:hypothetical protein
MDPEPISPFKISDISERDAMRKAQEDPNWKFSGGMTVQLIEERLADLGVKALGGPASPPEKLMVGNMCTYDEFAKKWPHALTPNYLAQMEPRISKPGELGYVLFHEGETLDNPEPWNQPQWFSKGFVEIRYKSVEG